VAGAATGIGQAFALALPADVEALIFCVLVAHGVCELVWC
jgi:hypothetical protein